MLPSVSFRTKLFLIYSFIVLILILSTFGAFYWRDKQIASEALLGSLQQDAERAVGQIDAMLQAADLLASQIKANTDVASTFYLLSFAERPEAYFRQNPAAAGRLQGTIGAIVGVDVLSFYRISVISDKGAFISIGAYADSVKVQEGIKDKPWFRDKPPGSFEPLRNQWILPPHADPWGEAGQQVISVIRRIETNGNYHSIVEIQVPYDRLALLGTMQHDAAIRDGVKQVLVFGQNDGLVVPPAEQATEGERALAEALYPAVREQAGTAFTMQLRAPDNYVLAATRSRNSEWIVVVSERWSELAAPIRRTGYWFAATGLALLAVSLLTVYVSSRMAVKPLTRLTRIMGEVPFRRDHAVRLFEKVDINATHNEVVHLYHSFRKMLDRLEESKEQAVQSYARELKARYIALQAQINPHFLYNTLSLIGMMGRDTGNPDILRVCSMLVDMLRYVTYASDSTVRVRDEVEHTLNYLHIMKTRYEDHLTFEIDIPETVMEEKVPKLTLQPFVENAIKHAFARKRYPWHIQIRGHVLEDGWSIRISDDGSGFPAPVLRQWSGDEPLPESVSGANEPERADGSGIKNTYERLKIEFGSRLLFRLANRPDGGAEVELGTCGTPESEGERSEADVPRAGRR
ncbi:MAG: histidine kinase [Paenibacillaceae bacterium]|nr:histidine kinase [Paenibacillaceae bacterium]